MNNSKKLLTLGQICYRQMSKTANVQVQEVPTSRFARLKRIQEQLGVEDNIPVYIKGGFGDQILYKTTWALTLIGMGLSLETIYILAFKK